MHKFFIFAILFVTAICIASLISTITKNIDDSNIHINEMQITEQNLASAIKQFEQDKELYRQQIVKETMLSMGTLANLDTLALFRSLQAHDSKKVIDQKWQIAHLNRRLDREEAETTKLESIIENHKGRIPIATFLILMLVVIIATIMIMIAIREFTNID